MSKDTSFKRCVLVGGCELGPKSQPLTDADAVGAFVAVIVQRDGAASHPLRPFGTPPPQAGEEALAAMVSSSACGGSVGEADEGGRRASPAIGHMQ